MLILLPVVGTLVLPFVATKNQRNFTLIITLLTWLFSLNLLTGTLGIETVFILLTTLLMPGTVLSSWTNITSNTQWYYGSLLLLEAALVGVFIANDVISFYVYFEASLIPLFVLLGLFGGANRKRATYLLFLYTLAGSLLLLFGLILLVQATGTTEFTLLEQTANSSHHFIWLLIFSSLAVKTPLIPLHIWLPRAHAEAPVAGSILLAGVVLKLATYGYIRLLLQTLPLESSYWTPLVQLLGVLSILYASFSALRQIDTKALIAISSVAHIGVVVLGLFSNSLQGLTGAVLLSLAHGLISPALFFLIGGVLYDRYHVRVIRYYRGLASRMPLFSVLFFLSIIGNMGVPLTLNFNGEFIALLGTLERSLIVGCIAAFSVVLAAAYSLWLFARMCFGSWSSYLLYASDLNRRELHVLIPWISITFFFGIYPAPLTAILVEPLAALLY